jgi:hypothetical protein
MKCATPSVKSSLWMLSNISALAIWVACRGNRQAATATPINLGVTQHHPLSRAARVVLSRLHDLVPHVTARNWSGKAK